MFKMACGVSTIDRDGGRIAMSMFCRQSMTLATSLLLLASTAAQEPKADVAGQRVFVTGHSFHAWIGAPLSEVSKSARIAGHADAGRQMIGGSRVIQHWDLADDRNGAKKAIRAGKVDVLTMSPHIKMPDDGIDKFTDLLLQHNAEGRVYVQASWYPWDLPGKGNQNFTNADRDNVKVADLRDQYKPFYESLKKQAGAINERLAAKHKRTVVYLVPVGHAVYDLRSKIADGTAPGLDKQSKLFLDPIGHPNVPVVALATYCYYAAIYRRSPVGLPVPKFLADAKRPEWDAKFNTMLQEIAWEAVTNEPLAGVKKGSAK
jgi:hypothetical protein